MSSNSRSGIVARTSSGVRPFVRRSSTSTTRIRVPRMQGCPPHCCGSIVMRSASVGRVVLPVTYLYLIELVVSGIGKAGPNVFAPKLREVGQNLGLVHAASQVFHNVLDGDAHAADDRLAAALAGLDSDDVLVVHNYPVP